MNDPVVARMIRIEDEMRWGNMDRHAATALVDAQIAEAEALAKALLNLMQSVRRAVEAKS